ncbi:retrovirus-related pol polyprotein from transposon TNT 1-94, partial [Tanacetum coccineum]
YAIVTDPLIYDSLITQFWSTASLRSSELGPPAIVATIDGTPYTITESLDQFGSPLAIALICLYEGQTFNWSSYIFTGMVNNINNSKKFLMFPRFLQMILDIETRITKPYHAFRLTSKMFANMRLNFHGDHMPLVAAMLPPTHAAQLNEPVSKSPRPIPTSPSAQVNPQGPSSDPNVESSSKDNDPNPDPNVADDPLGGSFFASPSRSTAAPPAGTTSGGAADLHNLTALYTLVSEQGMKIESLESELQAHKILFKDVMGKLVKRVKFLESKFKARGRNVILSESDNEEDEEQDVDSLIKLAMAAAIAADTSFVPVDATQATAFPPSSSIHTDAFVPGNYVPTGTASDFSAAPSNKGKSPMVEEDPPIKERSFRQMEDSPFVNSPPSTPAVTPVTFVDPPVAPTPSFATPVSRSSRPRTRSQSSAANIKTYSTRRKSLATRMMPSFEVDLNAPDKSFIQVLSDNDSDDSNDDSNPLFWHAFAAWEVIPTGLGNVNALYFTDKSSKYFTHLREILHLINRQDLSKLYGMVVKHYEVNPLAGTRMILWGDLHVLFESTTGGSNTSYPLSASLMKKILKHKLEVEIDGPNRLASPRVNGYLVKASSNPFTFYDSPLPGVNTPWDVMRIVCNPELMDVAEVVQSWLRSDKDKQKIGSYCKDFKKPTNLPTTTSELLQTPEDKNVILPQGGTRVVQQYGIQCFNCKEFGHYAKECRKPKRVKDSTYHKEKMLMCKQAEKSVQLQVEQSDWLADTDEEIDEQELEAHYSYMAKIQEVPNADSRTDSEPLEQVQYDTDNNVFANDIQHFDQSESISNTCAVETDDSNVTPDSPDMCDNDIQDDQNDVECDDERVALANLIANLKLDVDENKKIQKQLKKANATLTQELTECKSILAETSRTLGESNSIRDSCLVALQNKQTEFERYKAFNDRTVDYDKLEHKLNEALGLIAQKETDIKEGLKVKAYEISVVKEKHDELVKQSLLTKSHYEGLVKEKTKVITDLKLKEEKDIDKMISMENQIKFLNEIVYKRSQSIQTIHMLAPKCPTFNGRPTFTNPRECDCLAQKLSEQTEFVSKEIYTELLQSFAKLEKHSISLEIALQECQEQLKNDTVCKEKASNVFRKERKSVDTKFDKPSVVRQPNAQRIPKPSVLGKPAPFSDSLERKYFAKKKSVLKTNESEGLSKPVTPQNLPQTAKQAVRNTNVIKPGMYRIASSTTQTRAPQLNQTSRNTNPRVSTSTGVAHKPNVSRPRA